MVIAYRDALWLLVLLIPLVFILIFIYRSTIKQAIFLCGKQWMQRQRVLLGVKLILPSFLLLVMMASLVFAYADVYQGSKTVSREKNGVEVSFLLDVSNSMLADDVYPTRLQYSQVLIRSIVNYFPDLWYSLSVFKGDAILLVPLTQDQLSLQRAMQLIDPNLMSAPGSNVARGIEIASNSASFPSNRNKVIIVLSDGELVNGQESVAIQKAKNSGKTFILVAVGSTEGSTIKTDEGTLINTSSGDVVISKANPKLLKSIAAATNGLFLSGGTEESFLRIVSFLQEFRNTDQSIEKVSAARYRLFVSIALMCFAGILWIGTIPWKQ